MGDVMKKIISVIGCGNMGKALIKGMLSKKVCKANQIALFDIEKKKTRDMMRKFKLPKKEFSLQEVCQGAQYIIVAVKPQNFRFLAQEIRSYITPKHVVISVIAGLSRTSIRKELHSNCTVVRVMPNLPATIGMGVTAISFGRGISKTARTRVEAIFSSIGKTVQMNEKHLNAVTALSGSGPAYVFYLANSLINSGRALGMSKAVAIDLVTETLRGASQMLSTASIDPQKLIDRVASKGGTTEAALKVFSKHSLDRKIKEAVNAAEKRARELSQ